MKKISTMVLLLGFLTACSSMMSASRRPEVRDWTDTVPPAVAYSKAQRALAALGATIQPPPAQTWTLSSTLHNAVTLNVAITPEGQGSRIVATGLLLPNKVVLGTFDEVERFKLAYFQQ